MFGEVFSLPLEEQEFTVQAITDCEIMFLSYDHLVKPCSKACATPTSQLINNLFHMTACKAQMLGHAHPYPKPADAAAQAHDLFRIRGAAKPFAQLYAFAHIKRAQPITSATDRSAMMREIRHLNEDGKLSSKGRSITLL